MTARFIIVPRCICRGASAGGDAVPHMENEEPDPTHGFAISDRASDLGFLGNVRRLVPLADSLNWHRLNCFTGQAFHTGPNTSAGGTLS
jgi:hypothetical protein